MRIIFIILIGLIISISTFSQCYNENMNLGKQAYKNANYNKAITFYENAKS